MKLRLTDATIIVATLFVSLFLVMADVSALPSQNIIHKARDATVLVATTGSEEYPKAGGYGSGVLLDEEGTILTNYHVIHRAEEIKIWFYDENDYNYYPAEIVGIDPAADLALLRLDPAFLEIRELKKLSYLEIEDKNFDVSLSVTAHGHMLGHQWSVTQGTISHNQRPGKITPYVNILQHTAQIHQGSSGGPLVTDEGKIVGINTYILMPKGGYTGIAYAIRGDTIRYSVDQMLEFGEVRRPAFRANFGSLSDYMAKELREQYPNYTIPNTLGLIAREIEEGDYAYENGLRLLDTVVLIDGVPVNGMFDIKDLMLKFKPDDVVRLVIIRHKQYMILDYKLTQLDFPYLEYYDKRAEEQFGKKAP